MHDESAYCISSRHNRARESQWTELCFPFWRHVLIVQSSREETVPGYGLAEQTRDPWSVRSVYHQVASAQYRSSTSGYAYRILFTEVRCLPKYFQFNSTWMGFNLKIWPFHPWLKQIGHNDRQLGFNFMSCLFFREWHVVFSQADLRILVVISIPI